MTKKEITEKLGILRKFDYIMVTNQNNRPNRVGQTSVTDYILVGNGKIIFIEAKLKSTKDKLSPKQLEFKRKVQEAEIVHNGYWNVKWLEVNENNVDEIVNDLVNQHLIWMVNE